MLICFQLKTENDQQSAKIAQLTREVSYLLLVFVLYHCTCSGIDSTHTTSSRRCRQSEQRASKDTTPVQYTRFLFFFEVSVCLHTSFEKFEYLKQKRI